MTDILTLLQNIAPLLEPVTLPQMSRIIFAMLPISGRITMLGLSRWTEKGDNYRTIRRFYWSELRWQAIHGLFVRLKLVKQSGQYFRSFCSAPIWNKPMTRLSSFIACASKSNSAFGVRDAKQFWGLEDFMNVKETAVTNAANLSLFMVNFSAALAEPFRQQNSEFSILDLKSHDRSYRYATEIIKMALQEFPGEEQGGAGEVRKTPPHFLPFTAIPKEPSKCFRTSSRCFYGKNLILFY